MWLYANLFQFMLIMFSLLGGKRGDLEPLQGVEVTSCPGGVLAEVAFGMLGSPPCPQGWGAAQHLCDLYSDITVMGVCRVSGS